MPYEFEPVRPDWYEDQFREEVVLDLFCHYMKKNHNIYVHEKYRHAIGEAIFSILTANKSRMVVIPLDMGLGKSTLLTIFLKFMAVNYPDFGAIVAKERLDDAESLARELGDTDEYGEQTIAYAWKGFRPDECQEGFTREEYMNCYSCQRSQCAVKQARLCQMYYPVVTISHERLFRKANSAELLDSLSFWINGYGRKVKRPFLFVDERPKFVDVAYFNETDFLTFMEEVRPFFSLHKSELGWLELRDRGLARISKVRSSGYLGNEDTLAMGTLSNLSDAWWHGYHGTRPELLSIITDFFANGGLCLGQSTKIATGRRTEFCFPQFSTVCI